MAPAPAARAATFTVTSVADSGTGTLRDQIDLANATPGPDTIAFDLAGPGPFEIALDSPLADIVNAGTVIDGTTQPGYAAQPFVGSGGTVGLDGLALGRPRVPLVTLRQVGPAAAVLAVTGAADVTIRGLVLVGQALNGVASFFSPGTIVEANLIGADASGGDPGADRLVTPLRLSAFSDGAVARGNLIGFSAGLDCVLIDFNSDALVEGNEIVGCGSSTAGPDDDAVTLETATAATVRGNLLHGAMGAGLQGLGGDSGIVVENNTITDNGTGGLDSAGVLWSSSDGDATTGTTVRRNVVTDNAGPGIQVTGGTGGANVANTISENAVSGNGGQGIDLVAAGVAEDVADGPTLNDAADSDQGGNALQNFPVIDSARLVGGRLSVTGWAPAGARVEIFDSDRSSGFGQGARFLGSAVEGSAADADPAVSSYGPGPVNGTAQGAETTNRFAFTFELPAGAPDPGALVATATTTDGTSEFGADVPVVVPETPASAGGAQTAPRPQARPAPEPPQPGPAPVADRGDLPCTRSGLVLAQVSVHNGRVALAGLARRAMAGQVVTIQADGRTVARPQVTPTGVFTATAPLPPAGRRARVRYRAVLAGDASRALKLQRRLLVAAVRPTSAQLAIEGRVLGPLARPVRAVTVSRLGACGRQRRVGAARPRPDGRFSARLPASTAPALYRLQTVVRSRDGGRSTQRTFTAIVTVGVAGRRLVS